MKNYLFLLVVIVILSACSSKNEIRTYSSGKDLVFVYHPETNKSDTISFVDNNIPISVLVENDTVWFHSRIFTLESIDHFIKPLLMFENKEPNIPYFNFQLESYSYNEYYATIEKGKFFNTNNFKSVSLVIFYEGASKQSIYDLDLDQFKHLNK